MAISQNFPAIRPTLSLNFARSKTLDPRITFTRSSTATYVDREGIIRTAVANQARFDHDPVTGESLGLLIEESRTNLWANSSNLTISDPPVYANWNNASRTSNVAISPDGLTEGDRNTFSTATASTIERFSAIAGTVYTFSIYLKKDPTSVNTLLNYFGFIVCWSNNGSTLTGYAFPDLVSGQNASDVLTDEWKRFSVSYTCPAGATSMEFGISNRGAGTSTLSQAYSVLCWGAQIEQGSFPTSYIPTSGSAVTRSVDLASISGSSFSNFYNPNGGTAYIDLISQGVNKGDTPFQVYFNFNSDASNRWGISHQNESRDSYASNAVLPYVGQAGVFDVLTRFSKTFVPGSRNKYAMTQPNGSDVKIIGTGTQGFTSGITSKVPATSQLYLGQVIGDNGNLNGTIAEFRYYPQELTPDQITTLIK